jgi:prefoldin subunit 5
MRKLEDEIKDLKKQVEKLELSQEQANNRLAEIKSQCPESVRQACP